MTIYVVTYAHPDEAGWQAQSMPHIGWLNDRVVDGSLLASGPLPGESVKRALLVLTAAHRAALDALIASDPFAEHGLIAAMTRRGMGSDLRRVQHAVEHAAHLMPQEADARAVLQPPIYATIRQCAWPPFQSFISTTRSLSKQPRRQRHAGGRIA